MDVFEALHGRRTIHSYTPEPVPEAVLTRALESALLAPNHGLTFPWRFTRVGPAGRDTIAALYVRLKDEGCGGTLSDTKRAIYWAKVRNPAELLVVSRVVTDDSFRAREDYATVASAIQNLALSVHADGYGTKWSTGGVTRHPETYAVCGIDPAVEAIEGFVWVGVPAKVPRRAERPSLDEVVRRTP